MNLKRALANKAAERRQMVAHGVSRGWREQWDQAPEGRQNRALGERLPLSPLRGLACSRVYPRLTPWATVWRASGAYFVSD